MKNRIFKTLLIFPFMIFALLYGCEERKRNDCRNDPLSAEEIERTNRMREEIRMRQIKDDWVGDIRVANFEVFGAVDWSDNKGVYCKRVQYGKKFREIIWESDIYRTGREFSPAIDPDSSASPERLIITYDYRTKK